MNAIIQATQLKKTIHCQKAERRCGSSIRSISPFNSGKCSVSSDIVEAIRNDLEAGSWITAGIDMGMLLFFTAVLFGLSVKILSKRMEQ